MKRLIPMLLGLALPLVSCGGGGGGSSSWDGPVNAAGFPAVAGTYSLTSDALDFTCSDGETSTVSPQSINILISESANTLTGQNPNPSSVPGATILGRTSLSGTVQHDGMFTINEAVQATVANVPGTVIYNYTFQGQFSQTGWAGDYTITFSTSQASCNGTTTFTGDKIN